MCSHSSVCSLNSSTATDDTSTESQHQALFKTPGTKMSQTERRKALLAAIKERRNFSINEKRGISEIFEDGDELPEEEPMEYSSNPVRKKNKKYAWKLMLSEYFIEKPDDLEYNWLFKLCPTGVRNLVVAYAGRTKAFNKAGILQTDFESALPGGGPGTRNSKFTILDCIYNPLTGCYYVLDLIAWNSFSLVNCSTEFRFFFLKSKLQENPIVTETSRQNRHPFLEIISRPAQLPLIEAIFAEPTERNTEIDGVIFYHSELIYKAGINPLVGWLKPFMLPEILEIPVHPSFFEKRPKDYKNIYDHVDKYKQRVAERRIRNNRNRNTDVEMVEDVQEE